jgi:hypothetical protein
MKVNNREKKLILATAALAGGFVLFQWIAMPLVRGQGERSDTLVNLEVELAEYRLDLRQQARIEGQYQRMASSLRQRGSDEDEKFRLLENLEATRVRLGLADKGTLPLDVETSAVYRKFRIAVELEGPITSLVGFLGEIAGGKEPLRIEKLNIRAVGGAGPEIVRGSIVISSICTPS